MPSETSRCRERLRHFCCGYGIDVGYGGDTIIPSAITVDLPTPYTKVGARLMVGTLNSILNTPNPVIRDYH